MAFRDFDRGFGLRDEPFGARHFRRDAVGAGSASVLGSIGRRLTGMEGVNRGHSGSPLADLSRKLIESSRPPASHRSSYGAFDRVLAAGTLQSNVHKHITAASSGLGLASKAFTRGLASDYSDIVKTSYLPTAMRDVLSAEARVRELSSAYSGVATKLDGLASVYGRYSGLNSLTVGSDLSSGAAQRLLTADIRAVRAGSFASLAEQQLSVLRPLQKSSFGIYRTLQHELPGWRSILKSVTAYGPVVVTPEDDIPSPPPPSDYTPTLEGLIPETATSSDDAVTFEEAWLEVVTFGKAVAQHHRTKVLIRVVGKDGVSFLVQVAAGLVVFWITYNIAN